MIRHLFSLGWAALALSGFGFRAAAQAQTPPSPGLVAKATDGERTVVFVTPTPDFTLTARQSIHPQLLPAFQTEWNGVLIILRNGKYTLTGNARVSLDGKEIQGQAVALTAGEHPLRIEFERKPGDARLQLQWQADFFPREPVPAAAFGHRENPAELTAQLKADGGRELVEEFNCIACHQPASSLPGGRRGPSLNGVGSRAAESWIFNWLEHPRHVRVTAVMPALLENVQDRADVAAYLAGLKGPQQRVTFFGATPADVERGKELFAKLGCTACHGEGGVALDGLGSKLKPDELANYLLDPLAVDPSGRMPDMGLSKEEALLLADYLTQSHRKEFETPVPAGNAGRGRQLVTASGCLNCHALNEGGALVKSELVAPAFNKLTATGGCLAENPAGKTPRFDFTAAERESVAAFLKSPDRTEAPVQDFHRRVSQFRCHACHELNSPAVVSFEAMPPPLTDAGNKLRAGWLDQVLNHQKRVRPWMALRMPHFGEANTGPMVNEFAAQAGAELGEGETLAPPTRDQIKDGVKLLGQGEGGLSCITCHDFRGEKSGGELRGPDLTEMFARIRSDWLRRWLREPSRIQSGTAMPSFFSETPAAVADKKIQQILVALFPGKDMPAPAGVGEGTTSYRVRVNDEPILFRTFMFDARPRAIAVGLPGGQSYCFDAAACRLRYIWSGDFLDMKPVWAERGGAPAIVLGTRYYTAPDTSPLRFGSPDLEPKVKFRGYKLVNKVPVFLYELDGVPVSERITVAPGGKGIVRHFDLGPVDKDVWLMPGESPGVTLSSTAGTFTGGRLKMPGGKAVQFDVTVLAK